MFAKKIIFKDSYILSCVLFCLLILLVFSLTSEYFLTFDNFTNIFTAMSVIGLMAIGSTFVIGNGGIDLSVGSIIALTGVVTAWSIESLQVTSLLLVFLISISVGTFCGFSNGLLVNFTRAPSFIVTLGTLSVLRALSYIISEGIPIYGLPDEITALTQYSVFDITFPIIILFFGLITATFIMSKTKFGIHTLIMGDNLKSAVAMGLQVNRIRLLVYMLSGFYSGLAGFIFMIRTNSGDPSAGQNYELMAITAVILGGANLFGGRATIFGTFIGILCLGMLQNGLNLLAISTFYQILFVGFILLLAAAFSRFSTTQQ